MKTCVSIFPIINDKKQKFANKYARNNLHVLIYFLVNMKKLNEYVKFV